MMKAPASISLALPMHSRMRKSRGSSLIEVLITILILVFSLLGLAGLLTQSLAMSQGGYSRTVAVQYIYAFADRMRANPAGVNSGAYSSLSNPSTNPGCGTSCTPAQAAQTDYYEWSQSLKNSLGSGTGTVTSAGNGLFTVAIQWVDPKLTGTQAYSLTIRP